LAVQPLVTAPRCRIDVWLWRARLFKTRTLAARFVEGGVIRLSRLGHETRVDKASRTVAPGDLLVFASGGRAFAVTVLSLGDRRGPPAEARALYAAPEHERLDHLDPEGGQAEERR
jgi:ribosomal 50S subunit-recycling heat shock protein